MIFVQFPRVNLSSIFCHTVFFVCITLHEKKGVMILSWMLCPSYLEYKLNLISIFKKNECEVPIEINIYIFKHECFYLCNVVVVAKISLHFIFRLDM
jgi:hypothetical protein